MRLLLFNTDLELGGTPTVVRELSRRLPAVEVETAVACLGPRGPVAERIEADGGNVHTFGRSAWQLPAAVADLWRLVEAERIDLTLSFLVHANVVAALANVRHVQAIQTTQPTPGWHWRAQRWAARRAPRVLCCSPSVAQVAHERSNVPAEKLRVIPNAVAHVADRPVVVGRTGDMRVGFLGRLDPVKRVDLLIDACRKAGVTLHVFGDGPDRPRLEAHAAGGDVRFHGFTPRDEALAAVDVLALTSVGEGMPMVLIEAMAAGVPVAGLDVPGVRDVIDDDRTGVLAADADALADALRRLRLDPAERRRLAEAALREARARFTWDRVLPMYRSLFDEVIGTGTVGDRR